MKIKTIIEESNKLAEEENKKFNEEYEQAIKNGDIPEENILPFIKTSQGMFVEPVSIQKRKNPISEAKIQRGFKELEKLKDRLQENKKLLDELIEETDDKMSKIFDLVEATEEQRDEYLKYLFEETNLIDDLFSDIIGMKEDRLQGNPKYLIDNFLKELPQKTRDEIYKTIDDDTISEDEMREKLNNLMTPFEDDEKIFTIRPKTIDFSVIKENDLLKILDEQKDLTERTINGMKEAYSIQEELLNLNHDYSIFIYDSKNNIVKDDSVSSQGNLLFLNICDEIVNSITNYQSFTKLSKRKGITTFFVEDFLQEKKQELENIEELKEKILEKQGLENEQKNFKDMGMKLQTVSMYRPFSKLFLQGDEIARVFREQAIVRIPFGLKKGNENQVQYIVTKNNYDLSDKDLKSYNTCLSVQWNLYKNNYPINTFIDEVTMYQIYKGDISFSYKPSQKELEQMKSSLLGMNTNQAKMEFKEDYSYLDEKLQAKYTDEGTMLPIRYKTMEIQANNGRVYSKKGYVFENIIPLFSFLNEIGGLNTAPLQIESVLHSSQMNDEITRVMKGIIADLYYFKNKDKEQGFQRKEYVSDTGEIIPSIKYSEYRTDYKKEHGKFPSGYWRYYSRRTIDSIIKDCKISTKKKVNGKTEIVVKHSGEEKELDSKTKQRFIESVVKFLRESKEIDYLKSKYIKDFILYNPKGEIIPNEDFITEEEKEEYKKGTGRKPKTTKNPSIAMIDIIITQNNK